MKIAFTVDCEGLKFLEQGNPEYKGLMKVKFELNKRAAIVRYNEKGMQLLYDFCYGNRIPASFMLLGEKFKPFENQNVPWIEWGYHSWSHKVLPDISVTDLLKEVKNIYGCQSFTPPMWKIAPLLDEQLFIDKMLAEGYKIIVYRGRTASELHAGPVVNIRGLKAVYVSATTRGDMQDMQFVVNEAFNQARLDAEFGRESIFVIATHDFVYKDTKALTYLWENLKQFQWVRLCDL